MHDFNSDQWLKVNFELDVLGGNASRSRLAGGILRMLAVAWANAGNDENVASKSLTRRFLLQELSDAGEQLTRQSLHAILKRFERCGLVLLDHSLVRFTDSLGARVRKILDGDGR